MKEEYKYDQHDLKEILLALDEEVMLDLGSAEESGAWYRFVIIGGSVMLLDDLTIRTVTKDIDAMSIPEEIRPYANNYDLINLGASFFEYELPYNYPDRLVEIGIPTRAIKFYRPSNEDLAVMKLYAQRDPDLDDLHSPQFVFSLDWDLMDYLVYNEDEARASALTDRGYKEMRNAYEKYAQQYGHTPNPERAYGLRAEAFDRSEYAKFKTIKRDGGER